MVPAAKLAFALLATLLSFGARTASGSAFLKAKTHEELQQVTRELVERTLLSELFMDTDRLKQFEEELRPMYSAMPKTEHGTLEPTVVRYALHRFFVQKHGWYVKGLEPAGQAWNSSAPTSIMKSRVPAYIQSLFEQRLHGDGMGLHDLAVFAATLSDFVHNEAISDVMDLFKAFRLSTTEAVRSGDVDNVVKAYVLQLLDGSTTVTSLSSLYTLERNMAEDFPAWGDFKMWVQDVRQTLTEEKVRRSFEYNPARELTLESVVEQAQELNDHLGAFQDIECRSLKAGLADIEYRNTGRVLLSDFYSAGLKGEYLFVEHVDYLRKLGALDESDANHPSVIIANYLAGPANCLASTSFHSVCCFDECEGLLGHLERTIQAPSTTPERIAELVSELRSDTVDAPRILSTTLVSRLGEIAEHHHGLVPLHGRLFAQWMHHVYPLECPYPHASGTTTPITPDEWMDESGFDEITAPEQERQRLSAKVSSPRKTEALPWTAVEELVVAHKSPGSNQKGSSLARKFAAFAAVLAFAVPIAKAATAITRPSQAKWEKHLV